MSGLKRQKSTKKVLYTIVFNSSKEETPVTGNFSKNTLLNKIKSYKKKHQTVGLKGICLLHDNAPVYKGRVVVDFDFFYIFIQCIAGISLEFFVCERKSVGRGHIKVKVIL